MNKKGQSLGLGIISGILFLIVGLMVINFIMPEIATARVGLNCESAESISDGTKLLCLTIDAGIPYWILIIISSVIGVIIARVVL
jgi:hypothetical protein